jgi:hypothetical protein
MRRLLGSFGCKSYCLLMAGLITNKWSCVYMARKWLRRYEDGHDVSTRAFFSVLPSAYLLRKARPLGHSSMCCAHSAGEAARGYAVARAKFWFWRGSVRLLSSAIEFLLVFLVFCQLLLRFVFYRRETWYTCSFHVGPSERVQIIGFDFAPRLHRIEVRGTSKSK